MFSKRNTISLTSRPASRPARSGAALLVCMFLIFFITVMVVNVLDTQTVQLASIRNTLDYERALYLASAGVHHVAANLENDGTWRGTVTDGAYPANDTYSATAVDGVSGTIEVTSIGVVGEVTRQIQATIQL